MCLPPTILQFIVTTCHLGSLGSGWIAAKGIMGRGKVVDDRLIVSLSFIGSRRHRHYAAPLPSGTRCSASRCLPMHTNTGLRCHTPPVPSPRFYASAYHFAVRLRLLTTSCANAPRTAACATSFTCHHVACRVAATTHISAMTPVTHYLHTYASLPLRLYAVAPASPPGAITTPYRIPFWFTIEPARATICCLLPYLIPPAVRVARLRLATFNRGRIPLRRVVAPPAAHPVFFCNRNTAFCSGITRLHPCWHLPFV